MKTFLTFIRWFFGVVFCISTFAGFAEGDIVYAIFILVIGLFLLPPVTNAIFKRKQFVGIPNSIQEQPILVSSIPQLETIQPPIIKPLISSSGIIINPSSNYKITLYNVSNEVIQKVKKILKDESSWDTEKNLLPLFIQFNIKCREVDEYINKYKPIYHSKVEELKSKSIEYKNSSEMDKRDLEREFYETSANLIYEKAACDLDLLFSQAIIDIPKDDELIQEYGFNTISKYIDFAFDFEKVRIDYERKGFEDLLKCGLAIPGEEIPMDEILRQHSLKVLNKIANKVDGFFKRKDKAIDYILADENIKKEIGKHISMRRIFKLKPLPNKFSNINLSDLLKSWKFVEELIKLIVSTYRDSERYTEEIKGELSWAKGFRIGKQENINTDYICPRAKEECKKKFSKSNPPKLPLHIGCDCYLQTDM